MMFDSSGTYAVTPIVSSRGTLRAASRIRSLDINLGPLMLGLLEMASARGHSYADLARLWHCDEDFVQNLAEGRQHEMNIDRPQTYVGMADYLNVSVVRIKGMAGLIDVADILSGDLYEPLEIKDFYTPQHSTPTFIDESYKKIPKKDLEALSGRVPEPHRSDEEKLLAIAYYEHLSGNRLIESDPLSSVYLFAHLDALEKPM